jgi:dTDP-4-amino-4,6-dideoxygalactose transaminase
MNEYAAAIGLASLDNWDQSRLNWKKVMKIAVDTSERTGFEVHPALTKNFISPYWIIKASTPQQLKRIQSELRGAGIDTRNWWEQGCAKMPAYKNMICGSLAQTNQLSELTLGLPLSIHMVREDFIKIENYLR